MSGRGTQADGSLVAGLLAEQKNADHAGAVLRFVRTTSELAGRSKLVHSLAKRQPAKGSRVVWVAQTRGSNVRTALALGSRALRLPTGVPDTWHIHAMIAWMSANAKSEIGGPREELRQLLLKERAFLDRLIDQAGDPGVSPARLVDLVEVLESLDHDVERLVAQLREETTAARRQEEERSVRQFVLRALDGLGVPQNAGFLQEYMWARERVDLDTRGFGALRRDERRSWERNPGRRRAYIVPALNPDGTAVSRLMARSDWPLERRLVLPGDERLIELANLRALLAARAEAETGDLPDLFQVLIEKYARALFGGELVPEGDLMMREASFEPIRRRVESDFARLQEASAGKRSKSAAQLMTLPEEKQYWGT